MLPLLSIRIKYLIRNPFLLFWTYLFLPGIIILFVINNISGDSKDKYIFQLKEEPIKLGENIFFNEIDNNNKVKKNYNSIKKFLYKTSFLVNDKNDCSKIKNFIKEEIEILVNCSYYDNFTNETTHIIKFEEKEKEYKINLNERTLETGNPLFFEKSDLDQDKIIDLFYVNDKVNNKNKFKEEKFKIFWELQSFLSKLLIKINNKNVDKDFKMYLGFNPYPEHYRYTDQNDYIINSFISFIIALQFSLIGYNFNIRMIDEKENKLNILLERQGISKLKYNFSWLITFLALFSFSIIAFIMYLFKLIIFHYFLAVLNILFFSFSIFSVCTFFTTCINTIKAGTTAVKFYNFGSVLLGFVIVLPKTSKITKIFFALIPQINLFLCTNCLFNLNNFEKLSWARLWLKAAKISYMETILIYILDILFYLGLSIFIQSYRDSGLTFYPFIKSFFVSVSREINHITSYSIENENNNRIINFEIHHQELSDLNQQKHKMNQSLKIINISKNFDDLKAVDNFNGELFSNEIFCLLGHNGAGKSTLINMISGIYDPDQGDILLNGKSLVTNKNYLYENIGLCQQEDIFFDYLTVQEHLEYMCRIKGSKINRNEIEELINNIELASKKNALCSTLSGGQKRKLCIALALIGDSKIILLDEPTSGMDVMARRSLWEFLKNYKKDKIILLTTHFLDEAEYLGDRIGIMLDGHFLCSGTSSFLKSKYPCGFNINLLINSSKFNEDYKQQFYNGLLQYEPKAETKVASKGIFSINIQSNNQRIPEIFNYIEENKAKYGIEDYTVSSTSLEDVFLKINNKSNLSDLDNSNKNEFTNNSVNNYDIITRSDFCSQLYAQIVRGLYPLYRNKIIFFFELLASLGFIYIFIFFFSDFIINSTNSKLNLIDVLKANPIYYYEKNTKNNYLKNSYICKKIGTSINFKKIKEEPKNIEDFMNLAYNNAYANIAKSAIYIDGTNPDLFEVYNTEVDTSLNGYFYANIILFISSFLKNNYDIEAAIIPEITINYFSDQSNFDFINFFKEFIILIIVCLISLFGFVIFLGGLMLEKIKEKRTNIKHLLYLSGSNTFTYWLGFYFVDYLKLLLFNILLIFPIYFVNGVAKYFGLDLIAISISSLSFIYFISFFCSKDDEGSKVLFFVVFGFLLILSILCLTFRQSLLKYSSSFNELYKLNFFDFTPITSMALSFTRIIISYSLFNSIDKISNSIGFNIQSDKIMGFYRPEKYLYTNYISQGVNFILYTILLFFAESGYLEKIIHNIKLKLLESKDNYTFSQEKASEDFNNNLNSALLENEFKLEKEGSILIPNNDNNDKNNNIIRNNNIKSNLNKKISSNPLDNPYVKKEIEKVNSDKLLTTRIVGLRKTYYTFCGPRNIRAINNLYLGLEGNEKFGLLGFNGSGKTTTFKAITNEIISDSGSITLFGYDTKRQFEQIRTIIGYCPQINPLFDFMKVREIIKFYLGLKTCNESVEYICKKFGLSKYLDTYTVNLSGGNKRKLTFAIAMMNRPRLLLLDEPSTGVDPESRRIMWRNINQLSNSGHKYNMILTTHSMEEAEVLCDTVSWLKSGNFIALGNPEELKIKYSAGYKLHIKFDDLQMKQDKKIYKKEIIEKLFNNICSLIQKFDAYRNFIFSNMNIEPYLKGIINILNKIKNKTNQIYLNEIRKDLSFEFVISINKENQKELFIEVLNMKNIDKTIADMNLSMQSLENILTSLN